MYERFYGLSEHPFSLTPDPDFIFINQNFQESLDHITYAINHREALTVLTGDIGTGKTTLCWALLLRMQKSVRTALILNTLVDIDDLLRAIIQDFNIKPTARHAPWKTQIAGITDEPQEESWLQGLTRSQLIDELNRFLLESVESDFKNVLVIDEAQNLSVECLEQLRMLSNLETSKRKLLQIIFSGQLELDQKLDLPQLRQLKQRISVRCSLQPFSKDDMVQYIYHRIWRAGGSKNLTFSRGALNAIYKYSRGYPRLINIISDRALLAGYKSRSWNITVKTVKTALVQLGMRNEKVFKLPSFYSVKNIVTAALAKLGMRNEKVFKLPSFYRVKNIVTAAAVLLILAGFLYFVRHGILRTILPGDLQTADSGQANDDSANTTPSPLTAQPANHQTAPEAMPSNSRKRISGFSLQVHSLRTQQEADRALEELKQMGYPVFQRRVRNPDNSLWYVVYIGPFAESGQALKTATTLRQREGLTAIVRR